MKPFPVAVIHTRILVSGKPFHRTLSCPTLTAYERPVNASIQNIFLGS
jgi:hypothetical protein